MRAAATQVMPAGFAKSKSRGLYSIKAWDNVHHFYFCMNHLGWQREKLSPLRLGRLRKKNYFWHQRESDAREVSDDACVLLAGPWWPSTTHTHSQSPWMTLSYVSQRLMLDHFFSLVLCSFFKQNRSCYMFHGTYWHCLNEEKPRPYSSPPNLPPNVQEIERSNQCWEMKR